ncbi:nucleotide disphospho-sugar-binding domain-containing protein [Streptomyces sp. NPDC048516]|uniref:nucleotide disphospho-sugar-binding domain-containing protein n=1 Tax=Streptomyces sp. NPDC048516 TaxID=3365565 RepID=UPI003711D93B
MRVLFTPMAWATHYHQMVGLVWAFRAAGHEVRVAVPPSVVDAVTGTGVMAVEVGGDYDLMAGVADLVKTRKGVDQQPNMIGRGEFHADVRRKLLELRMVPHIKAAEDVAEDLVAFARVWRPDLVITDPLVYAAPLAAAAVNAPVVRHLWGPDMSRNVGLPGTGVREEDDPRAAWPAEMVELYEKYGAKPQADVAARTIDTCPESLQIAGVPNRVAMRYSSYNGATVAPSWLLEPTDRPRVCVTWGSAATTLLGSESFMVPRILEALTDLDVDIVVAIRQADRERLDAIPDRARVVEGLPLELIMPTCDAIVHQSGAGTALTAALYGVPQLTLPQVGDQGLVSDQLSLVGAGLGLKADEADTSAIKAVASKILSTGAYRTAARRLREEMIAQPAPSEIVKTLEELV